MLSGMYGFSVVAAPQSVLGSRARGLGSPRSLSQSGLLPRVHDQAGDTQNVSSICSPQLMALPPGPGEASTQELIRIWLKKTARPRECQRLWVEAEAQLGYSIVLLSLLPLPPVGLGKRNKRGEGAKQQMLFFSLGPVVTFMVNSDLLPDRLSDLGGAPCPLWACVLICEIELGQIQFREGVTECSL